MGVHRKPRKPRTYKICSQCGCRVEAFLHSAARCALYRKTIQLRNRGLPLRQVGRQLGISGERVRQIYNQKVDAVIASVLEATRRRDND